jgi:hypothetical protein
MNEILNGKGVLVWTYDEGLENDNWDLVKSYYRYLTYHDTSCKSYYRHHRHILYSIPLNEIRKYTAVALPNTSLMRMLQSAIDFA